MDLRMIKTRKQITEAFLTLRKKLTPDKIKVKDICEVAMINKTTFYNHYTDSSELSNEIDNNTVDKVMSVFANCDKIFDDPSAYVKGLMQALEQEADKLKLVFNGKYEILCTKLEERLCKLYDEHPNENKLRLAFAIGGSVRAIKDYLFEDAKYDINKFLEHTTQMVDTLLHPNRLAKEK